MLLRYTLFHRGNDHYEVGEHTPRINYGMPDKTILREKKTCRKTKATCRKTISICRNSLQPFTQSIGKSFFIQPQLWWRLILDMFFSTHRCVFQHIDVLFFLVSPFFSRTTFFLLLDMSREKNCHIDVFFDISIWFFDMSLWFFNMFFSLAILSCLACHNKLLQNHIHNASILMWEVILQVYYTL